MGVSFKVSKRGSRFRPKPQLLQSNTNVVDEEFRNSKDSDRIPSRNESAHTRKLEGKVSEGGKGFQPLSGFSEGFPIAENEVSFTLNLFRDGYSIGKPSKNEAANQITPQDIPKLLLPYDRTSESLFSAIESDRLPGDVLDDIPCKFVDGTLLCEVWDYRNYTFDQGLGVPSTNGFPIVNKIQLKMSLENVVKDIPLVSDNTWTYGDLMEVESRILKALKPQLHLDPTPKLDRLCNNPASTKLNLSHCSLRRKWLKQLPEVSVTSNSKVHGRNICIDRVPESSNGRLANPAVMSGNMIPQQIPENMNDQDLGLNMLVRQKSSASDAQGLPLVSSQSRYSMGIGTPRNMPEPMPGPIFYSSGASPAGPDVMSCGENVDPSFSLLGKRENQDSQMSLGFNKRQRSTSAIDGAQQHQLATHMDNLHGSDVNWKNTLLQQQAMASGIQHTNTGIQKFSQQVFEGVLNQDTMTMPFNGGQPGVKYGAKEEQFKTEKLDGSEPSRSKSDMQMAESEMTLLEPQQSRLQQKLQHQAFMRSNFRQAARNNLGQHIENDTRKEEQIHKTKMTQSPRLSAGSLVQSPLSSKSGEFSSGSGGPQHYSAATNNAAVVASQKEKAAIAPAPAIGGNPSSLTSSANDSMQRQHQAAAKQRSNSLPKTPAMNGVGSPTSVSNMSVPMNANSPSVGTPPLADQTILERFSKIEMVMRHQLNRKKNKVEDCPTRKLNVFPAHNIMAHLANASNFDDIKDDTSSKKLSKSLIGGSLNTCKKRTVKALVQERIVQGNAVTCVPRCRTRMILSERLSDGTVAMAHGELEEADFVAAEEFLPTLPNTHLADLLADQFHALMEREGYDVEDHIQLKQNYPNPSTSSQLNPGAVPINSASEMHQFTEPVPGPQSNEIPKHGINQSLTPSQNHLPNTRMLPPGTNSQAIQMSQGIMSGVSMPQKTPEMDPQQPLLQQQPQQPQTQQQNQHSMIQQQQHPQFQRLMLASNPLSSMNFIGQNPNMQLGNHMVNKPSALQLQVLQQQQQQQQHQQQPIQRKLMMGLGTAVGMGNLGNNMMGLGGLGNATGLGAARGMGGPGISSSPMAPISGNVGQNPMNLSQASNITNAISQQLRSGALTPAQAQAALMSELRMQQQNRVSMLGGPQLNLAGLPRARQIHPGSASLSMLGQALNRANMSPLQRAPMGPTMGPPKLMAGMNLYMNQQHQHQQQQMQLQQQMQQQQQQQQQQHQQQQQQHQQQQQQQQQQPQQQQQQQQLQPETSSIQTVVSLSPPQVGSPSTMGISQPSQQIQQQQQQQQQQQMSPQQMGQRTPLSPQQMSSGAIHALSAGNQEACPASPQLSSQTVASIGNIAHSPMEIQGVNKSSYVNNG